jgi:hypothetical protein
MATQYSNSILAARFENLTAEAMKLKLCIHYLQNLELQSITHGITIN